ncbi:MAG TPA: nickel pincer cofactor biosynthesis protein LarC, partial [Bacteroidota bacterium]|nr:nickel pincer cofactor biosynthesis protein LarC [Bacteroidota bacterium]
MKIAYFDTIAGISGDMTLGAFVSAGVPFDDLVREVRKLKLKDVELEAGHIQRSGITAVKVNVILPGGVEEHHHHIEDEEHGHSHSHPTKQKHSHGSRTLADVFKIIDGSTLDARVKGDAKKIFTEVARAEGKVHDKPLETLHFHEVGMLDSIVDICGAAICLSLMDIEAVYSSPVKTGAGGFSKTAHGLMPRPSPAAAEILRGYPVELSDIPHELTTPTGAAIIKALSRGVLTTERFTIQSVGYGTGTYEYKEIPNLLRVMVGTLEHTHAHDDLISIETNIDDMNPEIFPFVIEQLLAAGAHDAYLIPVIMKKGRPGMLLSVLTERSKERAMLEIIFSQTTTLGVRVQPVERRKLERKEKTVTTEFGQVRMKAI